MLYFTLYCGRNYLGVSIVKFSVLKYFYHSLFPHEKGACRSFVLVCMFPEDLIA